MVKREGGRREKTIGRQMKSRENGAGGNDGFRHGVMPNSADGPDSDCCALQRLDRPLRLRPFPTVPQLQLAKVCVRELPQT